MGITSWAELAVYLRVDVKLSSGSIKPAKSRHKILFAYFVDKEFNRQSFNEFISSLKDKHYKDSYINNFIKLAKHIDKYMGINQLQDYTYYKEKKNVYIQLLTPEEIEQLAECILPYSYEKNYLMKTMIYLLGRTGARINEILSLQWDDVFDTFIIFRDTKNGDDRKVPIFNSMYQLLDGMPRTGKTVFNISPQKVNEDLKLRAKACRIQKTVYCHLFRHSYINYMITTARTPLHIVQTVVGHKSLESTQRYLHPQMDEILYCMAYHPLEHIEQKYSDAAKLIEEFIDKRIDKRFKVYYEIKEMGNNSLI